MLKGRARAVAIVLVLAVAGLVAFFGFGSSAPTGSAPGVSQTLTQAQTPSPAGSAPVASPTLSQTPPPARAPTGAPALVTVAGTIKQILANGNFVMNDGHLDYTIAMSPTPSPKIVNRAGVEVTKEFIQADGTVQITGVLSGSTISAQTVVIPTDKAKP